MWSMRSSTSPVVGRVLSFDGDFLTVILMGLADQELVGGEVLLGGTGDRRYARIHPQALRDHWTCLDRIGGSPPPRAHSSRQVS